MRPLPGDDRVQDLLTEIACGGGGERELAELRGLEGVEADALVEEFELAAAAAELAMMGQVEAMPASVRAGLNAAADDFVSGRLDEHGEPPAAIPFPADDARAGPRPTVALAAAGWLAAAACLVIAALAWMRAAPEASAPELRQALLDSGADVITASWIGVGDLPVDGLADHPLDSGVAGDVVWSDERDEGYMRISGIQANDPGEFQYQLWIFDADRPVGERPDLAIPGLPDLLTQRPVDGGVFDITVAPGGEAVIPIDAKLPIGAGTIFAVTKERPGGVVVSDREIVFLAVRG